MSKYDDFLNGSHVKFSKGNSKMGAIQSVSLPSVITCRQCDCQKKCYARKLERIRKNVREAYRHNYDLLLQEPDIYWREVGATITMSRFFRFHVSGDIPNPNYFYKMVEISKECSHCSILCFTKKYEIVNDFLFSGGIIPPNLQIVFSAWVNLEMVNPFNLPEAHVLYKDGTTTARPDAIKCNGNCAECAVTDSGCWTLKHGQQVVFNEH